MISGFTIILEDEILFCSNEHKYSSFEIVLFVEKLLNFFQWRLKNICLKNKRFGRECIIVEHIITKAGQNLFFCCVGKFSVRSQEAPKMLKEFLNQVCKQYNDLDRLKFASEEPTFDQVINLIIEYLHDKYLDPLEEEAIYEKTNNNGQNNILYAGISAQGLPIISQLYDDSLLKNLEKEKTNENIELFTSDLSAKLATISMNTQIRAKTKIKEIHLDDANTNQLNNEKKVIFFGNIYSYSIDFIATGNFYTIKSIFKQLKAKMALDSAFKNDFLGDLRPYRHLKLYLDEAVKELDQIY